MWQAVAALIGGKLLEGEAQRKVAKKQMNIAMMRDTDAKARQARATEAIERYLKRGEIPERDAERLAVRDEMRKNLSDSVGAVEKFSEQPIVQGKTSDAYAQRVAGNAASNTERVKRAIEQLATIGTPSETARRDSVALGRSALDVGAEQDAIRNLDPIYGNMIENVRPNGLLMLASQALQGYGMGQMMGGAGGGNVTGGVGAGQTSGLGLKAAPMSYPGGMKLRAF